MGRGCFGLLGGFLAIAVLATTIGCGQYETVEVKNLETDATSAKAEGECCGGCCSEETDTKATECCGKCEKETSEVASKECCGKCSKDDSVLTSTKATEKTEACEYCKSDKACKECEKSAKEVVLETSAAIKKEDK